MRDRRQEMVDSIRASGTLDERLNDCAARVAKMCSEKRPPKMTIPCHWNDDDIFICQVIEDARAALSTPAAEPTAGDAINEQALAAQASALMRKHTHGWLQNVDGKTWNEMCLLIAGFAADAIRNDRQRQARPSLGADLDRLESALAGHALDVVNGVEMRGSVVPWLDIKAEIDLARAQSPSLGAAADAVMAERERCAALCRQLAEVYETNSANITEMYMEHGEQESLDHTHSELDDAASTALRAAAAAIRASSTEGSPKGSPEGEGGRET